MNSKRKVILTAAVIILVSVVFAVHKTPAFRNLFSKNKYIFFELNTNASSGTYYKYELDRDDILRGTDHYSARHSLNCVPGYSEIWEFEIIGDGEVTITWTGYENGIENEEISFYETYLINNKEHVKIFDSREAA